MDMKIRRRLATLHGMLGSNHAGERENARAKIIEILCEHGCSWNDLPDLLRPTGGTALAVLITCAVTVTASVPA